MRRFTAALTLAMVAPAMPCAAQSAAETAASVPEQNQNAPEALAKTEASTAELSWLALVDTGKYAESWKLASSSFRKVVPEEKWTTGIGGVRSPLGNVLHREPMNATYSTHLPGAPDGHYVITQYRTRFENKVDAVETVVAQKDTDGIWRISGYYVK